MLLLHRTLDRSANELIADFELGLKTAAVDSYSRGLVEFCSLQALQISDGSFSRFTFDMMLAWETPTPSDQQITVVGDSAYMTPTKENALDFLTH
jgi:hypothetical protein